MENTPPTVDFLPSDIRLDAGQTHTFKFGKPYDFEGNNVAVDGATCRSKKGAESSNYDYWLTLRNSTVIEKVELVIDVPFNAITEEIEIAVMFKDDHRFKPLKGPFKIKGYITAQEDT